MRSFFVCLALMCISHILPAQFGSPNELFIHAGLAVPASTNTFTDYWHSGFSIGGGVGLPIEDALSLVILADLSRFSFNEERVYRYLQMPAQGNSIDGAGTTILTLSAHAKSSQLSSGYFPVYLTGGLAFNYAMLEASTQIYSGYSVTTPAKSSLSVAIAGGAGVEFALQDNLMIFGETRYLLALLKKSDANAGYTQILAGCRLPL